MKIIKYNSGKIASVTTRHADRLIDLKEAIEYKEEKEVIETKEEKKVPATKGKKK